MFSFITIIILTIHPLPVEALMDCYRKADSVSTRASDSYDITTVHPFNCGRISPDWTSCRIDSTGKRRNKFIEYHFPVSCQRSIRSAYTGRGWGMYYDDDRKKSAIPVTSELVFRFHSDRLEYVALRHVVRLSPADTVEFRTGLVADVDVFSNQIQSFWIYGGGKIVKEYLWLGYPAYNPNYPSNNERYWNERYLIEKLLNPEDFKSGNPAEFSEKRALIWRAVRHNLIQYKYFYHTNE